MIYHDIRLERNLNFKGRINDININTIIIIIIIMIIIVIIIIITIIIIIIISSSSSSRRREQCLRDPPNVRREQCLRNLHFQGRREQRLRDLIFPFPKGIPRNVWVNKS